MKQIKLTLPKIREDELYELANKRAIKYWTELKLNLLNQGFELNSENLTFIGVITIEELYLDLCLMFE